MRNILLCGITGRMGKVILTVVDNMKEFKVIAGVCSGTSFCDTLKSKRLPAFNSFREIVVNDFSEKPDIIIDFSSPRVLDDLLTFAKSNKIPTVIGTTGYTEEQVEKIKLASRGIPIFFSGNMSIGVNLLIKACESVASVLKENCDVEIIEKHHRNKKDAPSGTALMVADALAKKLGLSSKNYVFSRDQRHCKRENSEIGISSVRAGTIVGEHSVIFGLENETITITHSAESRNIFAKGALMAANFVIKQKPGIYGMKELCENMKCC